MLCELLRSFRFLFYIFAIIFVLYIIYNNCCVSLCCEVSYREPVFMNTHTHCVSFQTSWSRLRGNVMICSRTSNSVTWRRSFTRYAPLLTGSDVVSPGQQPLWQPLNGNCSRKALIPYQCSWLHWFCLCLILVWSPRWRVYRMPSTLLWATWPR